MRGKKGPTTPQALAEALSHSHAHELLLLDLIGLIEDYTNLLVVISQGCDCSLELVADIQLVRIKQQDDKI